jgi:hypothetical protein
MTYVVNFLLLFVERCGMLATEQNSLSGGAFMITVSVSFVSTQRVSIL